MSKVENAAAPEDGDDMEKRKLICTFITTRWRKYNVQ